MEITPKYHLLHSFTSSFAASVLAEIYVALRTVVHPVGLNYAAVAGILKLVES